MEYMASLNAEIRLLSSRSPIGILYKGYDQIRSLSAKLVMRQGCQPSAMSSSLSHQNSFLDFNSYIGTAHTGFVRKDALVNFSVLVLCARS